MGTKRKLDSDESVDDSSSKSKRRKTRVSVTSAPSHFSGPSYQAADDSKVGGVFSQAVLGPNGYDQNGKSMADSSKPSGIIAARIAYPEASFKAGHLLNETFGGSGKDASNLTILGAKGNSSHRGFDEPVKRAAMGLYKLYEVLAKDYVEVNNKSVIDCGISVSVRASDEKWGASAPDKYICEYLTCEAKLVNPPDLNAMKNSAQEPLSDRTKRDAQAQLDNIKRELGSARKKVLNPKPT